MRMLEEKWLVFNLYFFTLENITSVLEQYIFSCAVRLGDNEREYSGFLWVFYF